MGGYGRIVCAELCEITRRGRPACLILATLPDMDMAYLPPDQSHTRCCQNDLASFVLRTAVVRCTYDDSVDSKTISSRDAVYEYLDAVFAIVEHYRVR